jgi:hypothetical protein
MPTSLSCRQSFPSWLRGLLVRAGLLSGTADAHFLKPAARRVGEHPPHVRMPQR